MPGSIDRFFEINRRDLVYLKFILEAYEGLSTLTTEDRGSGIVRITIPWEFREDVDCLLQALKGEIHLREVASPRQGESSDPSPQFRSAANSHA